jgi:hypothetical protein
MTDNENRSVFIEMYDWNCARCGCAMSMPQELNAQLRSNHKEFYCVSGHPNVYNKKTDIEDIQGKLMNEYAKNAQLEAEIARLNKSLINRIFKK